MKNRLIPTISNITQFGLKSNLALSNKVEILERGLVQVYSLYFEIEYRFEETVCSDFDKSKLPNIRENIISNFPEFGLYKIADNITNCDNTDETLISDAVDDLCDIIVDLLEVKWIIENDGVDSGLWLFELSFQTHTKQHILSLLNYIEQLGRQ